MSDDILLDVLDSIGSGVSTVHCRVVSASLRHATLPVTVFVGSPMIWPWNVHALMHAFISRSHRLQTRGLECCNSMWTNRMLKSHECFVNAERAVLHLPVHSAS